MEAVTAQVVAARVAGDQPLKDAVGHDRTLVVHPSWGPPGEGAVVAQALDLAGAFRQVAVRADQQKFVVIACWNPRSGR